MFEFEKILRKQHPDDRAQQIRQRKRGSFIFIIIILLGIVNYAFQYP